MASSTQLEDTKGLKMQSQQSNNTENNIMANMQGTECQCAKLVPLTDEEIWDAYMKAPVDIDCHVSDLHKFARAIEAAHGIKGEA